VCSGLGKAIALAGAGYFSFLTGGKGRTISVCIDQGRGLSHMEKRARAIGGTLTIQSAKVSSTKMGVRYSIVMPAKAGIRVLFWIPAKACPRWL